MPQSRSKKIYIYIFLFFLIGTLNNKNLDKFNLIKLNNIEVIGLDEKDNLELINDLNFLKLNNLIFINEKKIKQIINSNDLVEKYSVFKKYPSTLYIKIDKTRFLAQFKKDGKFFFLGSNGKFIRSMNFKKDLPFIFGNFDKKSFFDLKKTMNYTNFKFDEIENLYFFKSGRWDIETISGVLIKLPKDNLNESLKTTMDILNKDYDQIIKKLDLRQDNQIIINGN